LGEEYLAALVERYGAVGLFLAALLNNYIPGLPPFYLTLVSAYAVAEPSNWYLGVLSAGLGAGLGKVALFTSAGALASRIGRARRMRRYASALLGGGKAKISIAFLVFLAASLPLPDDLIYIPLGAAAFNLGYFAAAVIAGKLLLVSGAYAFGSIFRGVVLSAQDPLTLAALVVGGLAASIVVTAALLALDWEKIYAAYVEKDSKAALKELIGEIRGLFSRFTSIARMRGASAPSS
jgi:membrane protein YqaA with SNARE-associated domain